uniref:Uncharacterized protein n=1 Tax=Solanum tuberosum TaxID=4113 RepID=M1CGP5_SOLTU
MIAIGGYTVLLPLHTATSMEIEISSVKMLYKHKVVMELLVCGDDPLSSQIESRILAIEGSSAYSPVESIECLKVGLKDYIRKHQTCFSIGENLKVGTGVANSSGSSQGNSQVVEAVVIINEMSELVPSSSIREQDMKTEVKQWVAENSFPDRNLARKAIKCALDDLKENNQGVLLSTRALKTCDYAPDLAKTLARLILSSNDLNFQEECCSLLGVQSQEGNTDNVGNCIREKIISVIRLNDRNSYKHKEAPTFLFEDDCFQKEDFMDEEYQEGEEAYNSLDL